MAKLTISDANRLLSQVKAGEWRSDVKREYRFKPQSGTIYRLERNGVYLWVANGIYFLRLSDGCFGEQFIKIPMHLKLYLWLFGVRQFVRNEIKAFNKADAERDYESLSKKF